jgi:translation initiation factor IF-3
MDYGRYVYEQEQRRRQSKRKATNVVIKEMKFRPKIDEHDYTTKMKHVVRFLGEGNKDKLTIMFRGREMAHPELGMKILTRVADDVADFATVESTPRLDGRNMTMVLHPTRKDGKKPSTRPAASGQPARNQPVENQPVESQPVANQPVESQPATVPDAPAAPEHGAA